MSRKRLAAIIGAGIAALIIAILTGKLLSTYGLAFLQVVTATFLFTNLVIGLIGLFLRRDQISDTPSDEVETTGNNRDEEEEIDSQQPDAGYQSRAYSPDETADDDTTDSTPATIASSRQLNQSSLLRSNHEIIDEAEDKLDNYVEFYNDGSIEITADDLNLYSRMMLQVIVKRLKYEYGSADTPEITVEEIRKAIGKTRHDRNNIEVLLFLEAAQDWLTPSYRATDIDYAELDETTVTVELKNLPEAVDWTLNDQWDYVDLPDDLGLAVSALNDARNRYENLEENEDTHYPSPQENYDNIILGVLDACSHAKWYPVAVGDDGNWDTFTDSADTLFRYLERDSPSQIPDCLKPMQRALENMEDRAEE